MYAGFSVRDNSALYAITQPTPQIIAAVVIPFTLLELLLLKITPAPTKPMPTTTLEAIRSGELEHESAADDLAVAAESGVLSPDEAQKLRDARLARRAVIEVDDFSQEEMRPG